MSTQTLINCVNTSKTLLYVELAKNGIPIFTIALKKSVEWNKQTHTHIRRQTHPQTHKHRLNYIYLDINLVS